MLALVTDAFGGKGGIAQFNRDLFAALSRGIPNINIRILPRQLSQTPWIDLKGVSQSRPHINRLAYSASALWEALQNKPDIVFCGHLYMAPLAALVAKLFNCRLVIQLHGIEAWTKPTRRQKAALESADLVISVSRYTKQQIERYASIQPSRSRVLGNTYSGRFNIDEHPSGFLAKDEANTRFVLLSVGRLNSSERYKGQDEVIRAVAELKIKYPNLLYLIAGEGDDEKRLRDLASKLDVEGNVRFVGYVGIDDLPRLYRSADLFVMPSTGEGFGIVYLEAMACGTIAVGLNAAGARDALVDGQLGILVRDSISETISRSIEGAEPDPAALSALVSKHFGRDVFDYRAQTLLRSIVNEGE